ncbi:MAG: NAD-dependent epimerase/dehydratase family protein [Elusimicrobia bacterium]|nr:NAD-dependent epimerase/dehydratase family protein [Elusimicrobiota bacterium]
MSTVLIAGATGFIGRALAERLRGRSRVIGLTRAGAAPAPYPGIGWRSCDLFSLLQCEKALEGVDTAFYLVHSMLPSAHLTQGSFQDMDLIMADNFARAAERAGVKQIIYLGGLTPEAPDLSPHLKSRLEVERTLGSRRVPVTALRSGLVVAAGGSSFEMILRIVRHLPVIPCPPWAKTPSQPISLPDLLDLLVFCLEHPDARNRSFDVGCPDVLSYRKMLEGAAAARGVKRRFVEIPMRGTFWCRHWVSLVTGAPQELVAPLLESMRLPMVARDKRLQEQAGIPGMSYEAALRKAIAEEHPAEPFAGRARGPQHNVRSVQRIPLPPGKTARWAAEQYSAWLPLLFRTFIRAERDHGKNVRLMLKFPRVTLLQHAFAHDRNQAPDRQVFYITGGLLARPEQRATRRARLEFREALGGTCLLVAIHDYRPTLPWPLYKLTQAVIHPWVVRRFARYLDRLAG